MTSFLSVFSIDITENEHKTKAVCQVSGRGQSSAGRAGSPPHLHTEDWEGEKPAKELSQHSFVFHKTDCSAVKTCDVTLCSRVWALGSSHLGAAPGREGKCWNTFMDV